MPDRWFCSHCGQEIDYYKDDKCPACQCDLDGKPKKIKRLYELEEFFYEGSTKIYIWHTNEEEAIKILEDCFKKEMKETDYLNLMCGHKRRWEIEVLRDDIPTGFAFHDMNPDEDHPDVPELYPWRSLWKTLKVLQKDSDEED